MRLGLISPKGRYLGNYEEFRQFWDSDLMNRYRMRFSGMSTGLLILAALTPPGYDVEFIDENIETIDFTRAYDLVGISGTTQQATRAYQISDEFRQHGVTTVLGGMHATLLPEEAKTHADAVVTGEAEYIWPGLLQDWEKGCLKPFYAAERLFDMKVSPLPRYDLLKGKNYQIFWVQATRGCPHDCSFCAASRIYGTKYRSKTVDQVMSEVILLKSLFHNFKLHFADDNLFVLPHLYEPLIERLAPLRLSWFAQTDISIAEKDRVLEKLAAAGCTTLFIGLESLSPDGLLEIDPRKWKLDKLKKYSESVRKIQSYGIGVQGAFIAGLDSDDESVFDRIIDFITENHLYSIQITILTPYPKTRVAEQLRAESRLLDTDWENYTGYDVNFVPRKMSAEALQAGVLKVYRAFYTPENMAGIVKNLRNALKNRGITYRAE